MSDIEHMSAANLTNIASGKRPWRAPSMRKVEIDQSEGGLVVGPEIVFLLS